MTRRQWVGGRGLAARLVATGLVAFGLVGTPMAHAAAVEVRLERLTSTEARDAVAAGKTTVIVPVGGTEQSGPHLALGKHNARVGVLAVRIAEALGDALVAPVVAYVPEGRIAPPAGHMRFAGTISISDAAFQGLLEGAAGSLRQHGFKHVVLLGDHGGYQAQLATVAGRLNREWAASPARAHFIADYYDAAQGEYAAALRARGLTPAQIGRHAGSADTSLSMALDEAGVRRERLDDPASRSADAGVDGDPRAATAALGRLGAEIVVARSVAAIRSAVAARR